MVDTYKMRDDYLIKVMKKNVICVSLICVLTVLPIFAQNEPYRNSMLSIEDRVDDLLQRMTLSEKIAQIRHLHSWNIFNGQKLDMQKLESFSRGMAWGFVRRICF